MNDKKKKTFYEQKLKYFQNVFFFFCLMNLLNEQKLKDVYIKIFENVVYIFVVDNKQTCGDCIN